MEPVRGENVILSRNVTKAVAMEKCPFYLIARSIRHFRRHGRGNRQTGNYRPSERHHPPCSMKTVSASAAPPFS